MTSVSRKGRSKTKIMISIDLMNSKNCYGISRREMCLLLYYYTSEPYYSLSIRKTIDVDDNFMEWIKLRRLCVPIAKITGTKEFYGLDFTTNFNTLDPRPETELVIESMIEHINLDEQINIIDLGCGTGCIGITALTIYYNAKCDFVDICSKALTTTKHNTKIHKTEDRSNFIVSNWWDDIDLDRKYDVVLCNPPYIRQDYPINEETSYDPHIALFGGEDGLQCYKKIFDGLEKHCIRLAIFEIGYDQGESVTQMLEMSLECYKSITVKKDYSGHDRIVICCI